ncbi:MAG TPA: 4-alpha-glucanotransferase [Polyangia bacterium]|jgi:4-alpha-glucanotransferase|nr:4-alpha-glucanotransferase [Polyangia bacterium]
MSTDRFGISDRYHDAHGAEHVTTPETRAALRRAMGVPDQDSAHAERDDSADAVSGRDGTADDLVRVVQPGDSRALTAPVELLLEDGTSRTADAALPDDLPIGYHRARARDGRESTLIVAPAACHLPDDLRTWGWAAQVYAARSRASWGMGDLADLARLGRWTRSLGAGCIMVNPLSAPTPVPLIEPSPYYPSSRRFRNPLFLRVEDVPGFEALGAVGERLANAGRALNSDRRIDRDAVFRLKMEALQAIFAGFTEAPAFEAYRAQQGTALVEFATYCALAERHGKDWRRWPVEHRRPDEAAVRVFRDEQAPRVRFHAWLQWRLDVQLAAAAREIAIVNDLPIGIDVAGADAWCWQELMAAGVSVGAPPDDFSATGQDWGLTPFVPHRLRAAGYRPFIETIRSMLAHAGGLRIDHVMGLFRLFWIPRGVGAKGGAYVRARADELLAIVAIESARAGAFIVGEDLGTVEDGVRETLAKRKLLSYRLLYFEPTAPRHFPELALTSVTTHDLATIAGLWSGSDVADQKRIGLAPNEAAMRGLRDKIAQLDGLPADASNEVAIERTYAALAEAPSRVLLATLDDALAVPERPNMPGTVTEWPNWSLALPQPLEEIETAALPRKIAAALTR